MIGGDQASPDDSTQRTGRLGKATLARRFARTCFGHADGSRKTISVSPKTQEVLEQRDKWTSDKRADDPLLYSSHPDFVTFAPDGPLRQITIQQMRCFANAPSSSR